MFKTVILASVACGALLLGACEARVNAQNASSPSQGQPYVLTGTQVWSVPDPVSKRDYEIFVSLPASYDSQPQRTYPVLYVTDADYAFPIIRQIARRVNLNGPVIEEFILVGLSYSKGDSGTDSRRRDYTPTPNGPRSSAGAVHGGGAVYQAYLKQEVLPYVEARFRADPARRLLLGHSFGGLLGAQIMFTEPDLFSGYILGSPSFWYDQKHVMKMEAAYARDHQNLPAKVFMYMGGYETHGSTRRHSDYDMVGDMKRMEEALKSRAYKDLEVRSVTLDDEDHLTVAPNGFTRGLMALLPVK